MYSQGDMAPVLNKKLLSLIQGRQTKRKKLKLIKWLQKFFLLKTRIKCRLCQHTMKLTHKPNKADNYVW